MKRALITGAAGFAGQHLARRLQANGWELVLSDCVSQAGIVPCDMAQADEVAALVETAGELSHVFHLAARTFVPESMESPANTFEVNLVGTVHLTTQLARMPKPPRLVFIGSAEAYGPPDFLPVTEEHLLAPQNPYAMSKACADQFCGYLSQRGVMEIIRVRPFNHSGAGQSPQFVLSSFAKQIADIEAGRAEPVLRVGNLEAQRDFSHVHDVSRGYELLALHGQPGEAYNICSGKAVAVREVLERLLSMSDAEIRVEQDPARMRPVDVPVVTASHAKLTAHTGWQPEYTLEEVLRDVLEYWRAQ
jgi:GDP-4-dehydro-6-deoxy-D-mannose reductase